MKTVRRSMGWIATAAVALGLGVSGVDAATLYLSAVAETFEADAAKFDAAPAKPVTYAALNAGYIDAGDPVGGTEPPPPAVVDAALAQALAERGYQPAAPGATPALLIVYHWGEIRHDSFQIAPTNHLKGNDRARLLLVARTSDATRIERDFVNDRYTSLKVGAMTRTALDRETVDLARDEMAFVVVSAYDVAALAQHERKLAWQVRMTTRAVGRPIGDSLVSLIHYAAPYFGRNESSRQDLKKDVVPAASVRVLSPPPALGGVPAGVDAAFLRELVEAEHAQWSGRFPND